MGKEDTAVKIWLSDNRRFADLFNGTVFGGEQVVQPEDLEKMERETDIIVTDKAGNSKGIQRYRDVIKGWRKGPALAVLACESQKHVHYAMPVRNMLYDGLTYTEQIRQIWKQREEERKKEHPKQVYHLTGEEYLSHFRKDDSICPVLTLVLYYDLKTWDGPTELYEMFGEHIPEKQVSIMKKYLPNYRINLVDAGNVEDEKRFHTDLQQVFGMLKYRGQKEKLRQYMQENKAYFGQVDVETYQALRVFLHSEKMLKDMKKTERRMDHESITFKRKPQKRRMYIYSSGGSCQNIKRSGN